MYSLFFYLFFCCSSTFLLCLFFLSSFISLLHPSFLAPRQWSKSEESGSLALWFPKKDLEKQVSWTQSCKQIIKSTYISTLFYISIHAFWSSTSFCCFSSKYRAMDLPMFKHYVGCATFIFLCIFVVQMFVTKKWVWPHFLLLFKNVSQLSIVSWHLLSLSLSSEMKQTSFVTNYTVSESHNEDNCTDVKMNKPMGYDFWLWFFSPSANRCWGCHLECWFVCCSWPWPSVLQVICRSVC